MQGAEVAGEGDAGDCSGWVTFLWVVLSDVLRFQRRARPLHPYENVEQHALHTLAIPEYRSHPTSEITF